MLTTAQENAVRAWVEAAILDCPELAAIPLARIVWANQDFAERTYPYALISYTGTDELNATPGQSVNDLDELETSENNDTTVSITVVTQADDAAPTRNQVASSYVRELRARARSFAGDSLTAANLAIRDINVVPDLGRLQGMSQWESRAVIDLTLGHALIVTETPGVIVQAGVFGTTTPPTPAPANPILIPAS